MSNRKAADWTSVDVIDGLAARAPTPAAGSAAALTLGHGAALGVKVVRVTLATSNEARVNRLLTAAEDDLLRISKEALPKFDEDVRAVESVISRLKASQRRLANPATETPTRDTSERVVRVPLSILSLAKDGLTTLQAVVRVVKETLICDAGASASLMWAAAEISQSLVEYNVHWLDDGFDWDADLHTTRGQHAEARRCYDRISQVVRDAL